MNIIIDTSILIDKLRGGKKWDEFFESVDSDSKLFLPTIVVFELFLGSSSRRSNVEKKINNFKKYFQQVDLSWDIAKRAAEIYRDQTKDIEAADCIIAATAFSLGGTVLTINKKHFSKIPGVVVY
ncbi:hypothetical protein A3D84_05695 [Candidatus Woesebacteria bacterium RIFCSPHIGHO2_02_FULL_42_20]|uniref:PIN domain-containing protein n=1 Tax=Candidatus Woesebacteria bacterium RIFCSPHIGHO2_12_FULL_41_24 TaxID=1802510 RepID=A0A1F8AU40_9BACT|nr:MAG: hypothetical protein A2W15_01255 [Candidatus Woesebacteria bacterium RBG_16_41_13]OGM30398.1 MAG: hypothetical protein A2873_00380 [Candidatus Woesebacteria bacterium RIFCSPHIGHO2_01_FULL_42_80]OGM35444.1 MAG: hypothetical protein A3D84_05695 [Candidatus Woesebacteria bacterium RIFCSPHIGHO2_02_FULL_42_20]OGM55019.1 MAG: hypothetical protein A3E44_04680 [Candidatus Woesebacteria bacterium RIFCSPHIGHO2_12_FULL_41_24]OGM66365.1 MAG: hypothetical protein A2969_00300 [Candidatus Woesebacteri